MELILTERTMSKHTPGPWIVAEDQVGDDDGNTIADVTLFNEWNTTEGIVTKEMPWEANARLIAAAPELLEFVEDVAEGLDTGGNPGHLEDAVENLEERAQCIIARIKGDE